MAIALSDQGVGLYVMKTTKYEKLVGITSAPATAGAPATIEVTELDSATKQYISDRLETPNYEFGYNYTKENFTKVKTECGTEKQFLIVYPDKSGEKFTGTGSTWIDAISAGSAIKGIMSFAVASHEHVEDVTTLITPA